MSQYNKTVLTNAGLELAKRANAGQAKFEITRAVTSADDWSNKTIQDIEAVTAIPNIMQQGTIRDTEEVESNNSVIGVSLCFANKDLSAGYQIRIIGLYVKEEGQENDFLYAVTTAVTPEYMPDFNDKVLYRFNMQMYLVIGKAQAVNVVINDGASVTHRQFDKYKGEVTASVKSLTDSIATKADAKTVNDAISKIDFTPYAKTADVDSKLQGYTNTVALTKLLDVKANSVDVTAALDKKDDTSDVDAKIKTVTDLANTKANSADVDAKIKTVTDLANTKANSADVDAKIKTVTDLANTKANSADVDAKIKTVTDLANTKANSADVDAKIKTVTDLANTKANSADVDAKIKTVTDLANTKANSADVYTKSTVDTAFSQRNSNITKAQNEVDQLKGRRTVYSADFNSLTDGGTYYIYSPGKNAPASQWGNLFVSNGNGHKVSQVYFPDDGNAPWYRVLDEQTWRDWVQLSTKSDVASLQNTVNNIDSTRTPIVFGNNDDDLFAFKTNQIRLYNGNSSTCKNLPPAKNIGWFTVQYVFEGPNDNGIAIYRSPFNEIWTAGCNGGSYTSPFSNSKGWLRVANSNDISNLQSTINQQNQTIQSLITRLNNAENEIKYIKDNYIEGKRFPASQEAQATAWENANPQGIAFITDE